MSLATDALLRLSLVNLGTSTVANFSIRTIDVCFGFPEFVHLLPGKAAIPCPGLVSQAGVLEDEEDEVGRLDCPTLSDLSPLYSSGSLDRLGRDDR